MFVNSGFDSSDKAPKGAEAGPTSTRDWFIQDAFVPPAKGNASGKPDAPLTVTDGEACALFVAALGFAGISYKLGRLSGKSSSPAVANGDKAESVDLDSPRPNVRSSGDGQPQLEVSRLPVGSKVTPIPGTTSDTSTEVWAVFAVDADKGIALLKSPLTTAYGINSLSVEQAQLNDPKQWTQVIGEDGHRYYVDKNGTVHTVVGSRQGRHILFPMDDLKVIDSIDASRWRVCDPDAASKARPKTSGSPSDTAKSDAGGKENYRAIADKISASEQLVAARPNPMPNQRVADSPVRAANNNQFTVISGPGGDIRIEDAATPGKIPANKDEMLNLVDEQIKILQLRAEKASPEERAEIEKRTEQFKYVRECVKNQRSQEVPPDAMSKMTSSINKVSRAGGAVIIMGVLVDHFMQRDVLEK